MIHLLHILLVLYVAFPGLCVAWTRTQMFLQTLQQEDLVSYFGTVNITESDVDLGKGSCSCESPSCSVQVCVLYTPGERYVFRFQDDGRPVITERVVSASLQRLKNFPEGCGAGGHLLHPTGGKSTITYCQGEMRGFIAVDGERLFIQPVKKKHLTDQELFKPHLIFRTGILPTAGQGLSPSLHRRGKRAVGDVKHLELLVIVGHDVYQFHQEDTERYILTNLNIGTELLRDVSLGATFRVHLVKMIILTEPEPDIRISSNINASLVSVCEWGRRMNPPEDTDPLHADLILYVTRFDLTNGDRTLRGVTQLGGACSSLWSCVITKDTGFDLGITLAHEIGHSFGINHDGTSNSCSGDSYIMAPQENYNSVHLTWSECSRDQFLTFIRSEQASCVNDLPALEGTIPGWKPGLYYGADEQCQIAFGSSALACTFSRNDLDSCRVLSCHTSQHDRTSCNRILVPLLDGTECGVNKWCHRGRCSSLEELNPVAVVHGAWSSWTGLSSCSRRCGGGVVMRRRQCNNPRPAFGGRSCEGPSLQAHMCNTQACETSQLDFMNEQCSATDTEPLHLTPGIPSFYKWTSAVGFAKGDSLCQHLCRAQGKNFMIARGDSFIDGTRCETSAEIQSAFSLCIARSCKGFGCDGVMGSGKLVDQCGVCGGDNSTCDRVSSTFSDGKAGGYFTFLTVPIGSMTIKVTNRKPLFTHLAIKESGLYLVSGKGKVSLDVTHPSILEDRRIEYRLTLTSDKLPLVEQVHIDGPTTGDLEIQVYRRYGQEYGEVTNPDISYSYFIPKKDRTYVWTAVRGPCSVSCGGGSQAVTYMCTDQTLQKPAQPELCNNTTSPTSSQELCGVDPCPPRWVVKAFSPCSVSCGGGVMYLTVRCILNQRGNESILSDEHCASLARPQVFSACALEPCLARWEVSELRPCSAVCGSGLARRNVSCVQSQAGLDTLVEDSQCSAQEKPPGELLCVVSVCPMGWEKISSLEESLISVNSSLSNTSDWKKMEIFVWSPVVGKCSVTCGKGVSELRYVCLDFHTKEEKGEENCNRTLKPETSQNTCSTQSCPPVWEVRERFPCPVTCGGGTIQLEVFCARKDNGILYRLPHAKCSRIQRPSAAKSCGTQPCPIRWSYKTGSCSVTCGGGVLRRILYCVRDLKDGTTKEQIVGDAECQHLPHPQGQEPCNQQPCPPRWQVSETGPCSSACGYGIAKQSVVCIQTVAGADLQVNTTACPSQEKPPSLIPCMVTNCFYSWDVGAWGQCSATCGNGIQRRQNLCVNLKTRQQVSPTFCGHTAQPLTMRGCSGPPCRPEDQTSSPPVESTTPVETAQALTTSYLRPQYKAATVPTEPASGLRTPGQQEMGDLQRDGSVCGQLFLDPSGLVSTVGFTEKDCTFSIGRPLGEEIAVKVVSSSLNCSAGELLLFLGRTMWQKKCIRLSGVTFSSKSNILTVRQRQTQAGHGVVLEYWSVRSTQYQSRDCDVQIFGMQGSIQNPVQPWLEGGSSACRIFIDVPPKFTIAIHAMYMDLETGSNKTHSSYILIRDLKTLRSMAFHGNHLFYWESLGSQAEIEFHGEFSKERVSFRAQYWVQNQRPRRKRQSSNG
ncbi:A disintegrin and metalloproteinase with thrombospondin motifs 13 [Pelodytes ibericus]